MSARSKLTIVQQALGMTPDDCDGIPGPHTQATFDQLCGEARMEYMAGKAEAAKHIAEPSASGEIHTVKASSFADAADVRAFRRCKDQGFSDQHCFAVGDNGVGFTGLDCTDESIPYVAIPPEKWAAKWGSASNASGKPLLVTYKGKTVTCKLGDTMPHESNIKNGCGLDMARGAQKAFGLTPPFTIDGVTWQWA
jgi:hypothetical protein